MIVDPAAGGARPVLDGAALLASVPGLADHADVVPVDLGRTPASHFTFAGLLGIAAATRTVLETDGSLSGAVIVQGTDTIDEAAFVYETTPTGFRLASTLIEATDAGMAAAWSPQVSEALTDVGQVILYAVPL